MKIFNQQIALCISITLIIILSACNIKTDKDVNQATNDELELRIQKAYQRIMHGKSPVLNSDFLLACITLDEKYKRRFTNFSGDQPGTYLSIMSIRDIKTIIRCNQLWPLFVGDR